MEETIDLRRARGNFDETEADSEALDWDSGVSMAVADGMSPSLDTVAHPAAPSGVTAATLEPPSAGKLATELGPGPAAGQAMKSSFKAGTAPVIRNSGRLLLEALEDGGKGSMAVFKKRPSEGGEGDGGGGGGVYDFNSLKNNSTSSLYIKDTLSHPDRAEVQRCVSAAVLKHIKAGHEAAADDPSSEKKFEIFNELVHPIERKATVDLTEVPSQKDVFKFISTVFATQQIPPECSILCLCYIERLLKATNIRLHPWNWRRVLLGTLMIASKVFEDLAVWNVDFQPQFPFLSVADLNTLERNLLQLLDYNVSIKPSQYANYFFELRAFSKLEDELFPIKPLSSEDAEKLEQRSLQRFDGRQPTIKRTKSSEQFFVKSPRGRAVLQ
eukprot:TRINITY_DN7734_c0_g1_i2.p1 TRINITY_DN7734_c0_g1~~TRINITY_DN7734_c0_g1_i2.p1  ORF type:complete len:385 (-),score=66.93 TRINITY_DN7734_c0_g1_i2:156-1310(-)